MLPFSAHELFSPARLVYKSGLRALFNLTWGGREAELGGHLASLDGFSLFQSHPWARSLTPYPHVHSSMCQRRGCAGRAKSMCVCVLVPRTAFASSFGSASVVALSQHTHTHTPSSLWIDTALLLLLQHPCLTSLPHCHADHKLTQICMLEILLIPRKECDLRIL